MSPPPAISFDISSKFITQFFHIYPKGGGGNNNNIENNRQQIHKSVSRHSHCSFYVLQTLISMSVTQAFEEIYELSTSFLIMQQLVYNHCLYQFPLSVNRKSLFQYAFLHLPFYIYIDVYTRESNKMDSKKNFVTLEACRKLKKSFEKTFHLNRAERTQEASKV